VLFTQQVLLNSGFKKGDSRLWQARKESETFLFFYTKEWPQVDY